MGTFSAAHGNQIGLIPILVFGPMAALLAVMLYTDAARTRLNRTGFSFEWWGGAQFYRWQDVDSVDVRNSWIRPMVVLKLWNRQPHCLPPPLGMSAKKLAAALNDWRHRTVASAPTH
jgi:hypothetical protein